MPGTGTLRRSSTAGPEKGDLWVSRELRPTVSKGGGDHRRREPQAMATENHIIEFEGSRFWVELDHDNALKLLAESGKVLPAIPAGANTAWEHFKTNDGRRAAVIMQIGIEENETDLGHGVSGATIIVCLDSCSELRT
jgi:hypothetical protein